MMAVQPVGEPTEQTDIERTDGPFHDGEEVIDSLYDNGAWDTLVASGLGMTLLGFSPDPMSLLDAAGNAREVQAGMFLTVRGRSADYVIINGGGA